MDLLSLRLKRAQDAWHSRKSASCADCHQTIPEPANPADPPVREVTADGTLRDPFPQPPEDSYQ